MLLLDTHVLIWLDEGNDKLGPRALNLINEALLTGTLTVASISFWEIAMLVSKQRISLRLELGIWRRELLQKGLCELPMYGGVAVRAGEFLELHGDPADRIIIATALEESAILVTADQKMLDWSGLSYKIDASQ